MGRQDGEGAQPESDSSPDLCLGSLVFSQGRRDAVSVCCSQDSVLSNLAPESPGAEWPQASLVRAFVQVPSECYLGAEGGREAGSCHPAWRELGKLQGVRKAWVLGKILMDGE